MFRRQDLGETLICRKDCQISPDRQIKFMPRRRCPQPAFVLDEVISTPDAFEMVVVARKDPANRPPRNLLDCILLLKESWLAFNCRYKNVAVDLQIARCAGGSRASCHRRHCRERSEEHRMCSLRRTNRGAAGRTVGVRNDRVPSKTRRSACSETTFD